MEVQVVFVGVDGVVYLYLVVMVDLYLVLVVDLGYVKQDCLFGFDDVFDDVGFQVVWVGFEEWLEGMQYFFYCLVEFGLIGIVLFQVFEESVDGLCYFFYWFLVL